MSTLVTVVLILIALALWRYALNGLGYLVFGLVLAGAVVGLVVSEGWKRFWRWFHRQWVGVFYSAYAATLIAAIYWLAFHSRHA